MSEIGKKERQRRAFIALDASIRQGRASFTAITQYKALAKSLKVKPKADAALAEGRNARGWKPPRRNQSTASRLNIIRTMDTRPVKKVSYEMALAFYDSPEWKEIRYSALKRDGRHCVLCGQGPGFSQGHRVLLQVDHVKPLRSYWGLRLDLDNLQTLCSDCNHGKGGWDETAWRHGSKLPMS